MSYRVRFTEDAEEDLVRLYQFILARDEPDFALAERALEAIRQAMLSLELSPSAVARRSRPIPFSGNS